MLNIESIKSVVINSEEKIQIMGIEEQGISTLGTAEGGVEVNGCKHNWSFQIIRGLNILGYDGILGRDFLQNRAFIDCINNRLYLDDKCSTTDRNHNNQSVNQNCSENNNKNKFETVFNKIGKLIVKRKHDIFMDNSKLGIKNMRDWSTNILTDQGFVFGKGLGKQLQGIKSAL